jgi:hypothetical protein
MNDFRLHELLLILYPLVLLQISLLVYCGIKLFKKRENLNQWIWLCICISSACWAQYLIFVREKDGIPMIRLRD